MNHLKLGLVLLLALGSLRALVVDSSIRSVTVFADRAQISRVGQATLDKPGIVELDLKGLPEDLDPQSLQVSGEGTAKVTILDVSGSTEELPAVSNDRIRAAQDELDAAHRAQETLKDRAAVLDAQTKYLADIRGATTAAQPEGQKRPDTQEWAALLAFNSEQLTRLAADRRTLQVEQKAADERTDLATRRLAELKGSPAKTVTNVRVRLDVAEPGTLTLRVAYNLEGAAWSPAYDTRVTTGSEGKVELAYYAMIENGTGEEWKDVDMTLSTARPNLGGSAPDLRPWIVDLYKVDKGYAKSAAPAHQDKAVLNNAQALMQYTENAMTSGVSGNFLANAPAHKAAIQAVARVDFSFNNAVFKLPAPVSLPSDSTAKKVPITRMQLAAKLQYQATPKLRETAFLAGYVNNNSEYPLLAGPANVFLDGTFVTTATLKTIMPGEKFQLALGADESVSVKRRLVNRYTETSGLTGKTQRITYEYVISLANNRKTKEHVVIWDQLPISRNEEAEVSLLTPEPSSVGTKDKPKEVTAEEDGKLVWRLDLKPGEKRELTLKFKVEHPVDTPVNGLD